MTAAECMAGILLVRQHMWDQAKTITKEFSEDVMTLARDTYCPIDQGPLRDSASVDETLSTETEYEVTLSFNTYYAVYVHEISRYHHESPTRWKYLETALTEKEKELQSRLDGVHI